LKITHYIARRYVFSRSKSSAINIITGITAVGIFAGALVMFVVLSVFSGLREYSYSFIKGSDPDLKLVATVGKTLDFTPEIQTKLQKVAGIASYSKFLEERALLRYESKEQIAYIKGVDQVYNQVNPVEDFVYMGQWDIEPNQAVVGHAIAYRLSVGVFDYENNMEIIVPKKGKGSLSQNDFNQITVHPVGIYSFNDEEIDAKYVYTHLVLAQHLLELDEKKITGIDFKLSEDASEKQVRSALKEIFGENILLKNRMELNETLHKMHNTENLIVYLIITLVVIITLFTLVGTIIMVILDKQLNLKTLYNLGLRISELRSIFLMQGLLLSFLGCVLGLILGIGVVLIQQYFQIWMLSDTLPYPVKFSFVNLLVVFVTIMVLSYIASKIASNRISEKLFS
jgi:lipoprotein-releasing system permease protein